MAAVQGGSAVDHSFITQQGGWSEIGGNVGYNLNVLRGKLINRTDLLSASDAIQIVTVSAGDIRNELGNGPFLAFQSYKIHGFRVTLTDVSFTTGFTGDFKQAFVFAAPWQNPTLVSTSKTISTKPNYLPGCQWKTMTLPSCDITQQTKMTNSAGDRQMMEIAIDSPKYFVDIRNTANTATGQQLSSAALPTLTGLGLDQTEWYGAEWRFQLYSGGTLNFPASVYFCFMLEIHASFTGPRWQTGAVIDTPLSITSMVSNDPSLGLGWATHELSERVLRKRGIRGNRGPRVDRSTRRPSPLLRPNVSGKGKELVSGENPIDELVEAVASHQQPIDVEMREELS